MYNIAQVLGDLGTRPIVVRNDEISLKGVERINPDRIVISPGPGTPTEPRDVGVVLPILKALSPRIPILGVCLGHQAIGYAFGARVEKAVKPYHGKQSYIEHYGSSPLYFGLPTKFLATRYHSLVVREVRSPLAIDARSIDDKEIMGIHHMDFRVYGVQFHPESIGTDVGRKILENFLNRL